MRFAHRRSRGSRRACFTSRPFGLRSGVGCLVKAVRITSAEIERAKAAANGAGLRLVGLEKRPDGTVKFEFGDFEDLPDNSRWFAGSPLYKGAA